MKFSLLNMLSDCLGVAVLLAVESCATAISKFLLS